MALKLPERVELLFPPLPSTNSIRAAHSSSNKPGMGLPLELWDHVISFLQLEPYPLLACCLTCHYFREYAEHRLTDLFYSEISLRQYFNIDNFVEEIRTIPGRAQLVKHLHLWDSPPLSFFIVPYRLAMQLVNLAQLSIEDVLEAPNVHSSMWWSIYGHALPNVRHLSLRRVQFPSARDCFRFIASFRALGKLEFQSISFARPFPLSTAKFSGATDLTIEEVRFHSFNEFIRCITSFRTTTGLHLCNISYNLGVPLRIQQFPILRAAHVALYGVQFLSWEDLICLLKAFSAANNLELDRISYGGVPLSISRFSNATDLTVDRAQFYSPNDLIHFITSFSINNLHLLDISYGLGVSPRITQIPIVSAMEITLRSIHFPSFNDFIRLVASFHAAVELKLNHISYEHPGITLKPTQLGSPIAAEVNLSSTQFRSCDDFIDLVTLISTNRLYLNQISYSHPGDPLRIAPFSGPNVTELILWRVEFLPFNDFIRFITSFSTTDNLYLHYVSFEHPGDPLSIAQLPSLSAKELSLGNMQLPSFDDFVYLTAYFGSTSKLYLRSLSYGHPGCYPGITNFPSISATEVTLHSIEFPSFNHFVSFITSFFAIQHLEFRDHVSFTHTEASASATLRSPLELNPLERLTLHSTNEDNGHFLGLFIDWLASRGCVIRELDIDEGVTQHPLGYLLLQSAHTHLQKLSLRFSKRAPPGESREPSQRFLGECRAFPIRLPRLSLTQTFSCTNSLTYANWNWTI